MAETLAIDIGGTKIAMGWVDGPAVRARLEAATPKRADDIVARVTQMVLELHQGAATAPVSATPSTPAASTAATPSTPSSAAEARTDTTSSSGSGAPTANPAAIAVAATGAIHEGVAYGPNRDTIEGWYGFALEARLSQALQAPVFLLNDAHAAAWGEYRCGPARAARSMAFVTVSTGVGAGVVVDGSLLLGARGFGAHLGHMIVDPEGPACGCGRRGCLEMVGSGRAMERDARQAFGRDMSAAELLRLEESGDPAAAAIASRAARAVARALANLVALIDPERVVIGGGVGLNQRFGTLLHQALEAEPAWCRPSLERASLGVDAGLVGIADLAAGTNAR